MMKAARFLETQAQYPCCVGSAYEY